MGDRDGSGDGSTPDERPLGERPGVGDHPLGASFRDGPRRAPAGVGAQLMTVLPFLALVAVVLVVASR